MADICMENRRKVAVVTGAPQDNLLEGFENAVF